MSDSAEKSKVKRIIPYWFTYGTLGIFWMVIGVIAILTIHSERNSIVQPNVSAQISNGLIRLDTPTSRFIIKSSIPILESNAGEEDPFTLIHVNWSQIYWRIAANLSNANPQEILKAQFPFMAFMKPRTLPIKLPIQPITPRLSIPSEPTIVPTQQLANDPEIFIYHTHTSESYIPVSGKDHELNQKGDIVKLGEHLQQILEEKYGLKCIHSEDINDQYPFRDSYKRAQETVIKYLAEYPSIKVVFDLHRDATPGMKTTCNLNGEKTATLRIIVGSDKMGLLHPNWRENLEFATRLTDNMNLYYPGLSNGILISEARYNQHLNNHALIVEFGDYQNSTLEELNHAIERFAEILVLTMNMEKEQKKNAENI